MYSFHMDSMYSVHMDSMGSFHMDSIFIPYHSMVYFLILAEVMPYSIWNPWNDGGIHPFHMEYTRECIPWVQAPMCIPKSIEDMVCQVLLNKKAAGKYKYSTVSYCSMIFAVSKPKGGICLVADVQELNRVMVHDAGLPPRTDNFSESFVGHVIYGDW